MTLPSIGWWELVVLDKAEFASLKFSNSNNYHMQLQSIKDLKRIKKSILFFFSLVLSRVVL